MIFRIRSLASFYKRPVAPQREVVCRWSDPVGTGHIRCGYFLPSFCITISSQAISMSRPLNKKAAHTRGLNQWIESAAKSNYAKKWIKPADMSLFMKQNVLLLPCGKVGKQINFGAENTNNKWRTDVIRQINLITEPDGANQGCAAGGSEQSDCNKAFQPCRPAKSKTIL